MYAYVASPLQNSEDPLEVLRFSLPKWLEQHQAIIAVSRALGGTPRRDPYSLPHI